MTKLFPFQACKDGSTYANTDVIKPVSYARAEVTGPSVDAEEEAFEKVHVLS